MGSPGLGMYKNLGLCVSGFFQSELRKNSSVGTESSVGDQRGAEGQNPSFPLDEFEESEFI